MGTATKSELITQFFLTMIKQGILLRIDRRAGNLLLDTFGLVFCPQKFSVHEQWPNNNEQWPQNDINIGASHKQWQAK